MNVGKIFYNEYKPFPFISIHHFLGEESIFSWKSKTINDLKNIK